MIFYTTLTNKVIYREEEKLYMSESNNYPSISIKSIKFKNQKLVTFNKDDIILLVGANNSGKSRTLKDIRDKILNNNKPLVLVDDIEFTENNFSAESLISYIKENLKKNNTGDFVFTSDDFCGYTYNSYYFNQMRDGSFFDGKDLYKLFYTFLSTENRLNITKPIQLMNFQDSQAISVINKLRTDQEMITKLNFFLNNSIKKAIEIDDRNIDPQSQISYIIGDFEKIEKMVNCKRRDFYNQKDEYEALSDQGDGIRSTVAILASLIVNSNQLYLIDEPETFLHPPQARQLGRDIGELSRGKQSFIATHNIDFIRGILESDSKRVKIIKIDRIGNDNVFNCLKNESVEEIAKDKNLKYSNLLNGLFYERVILCEDESDCKFYSAILETINTAVYQSTLFCAVGGKGQFKRIIPLLKELHITWYIIADIDLINNSKAVEGILNSIKSDNYKEVKDSHKDFLNLFKESVDSQIKKQVDIQRSINDIFKEVKKDKYMSDETSNRIKELLKNTNSFHLLKTSGVHAITSSECYKNYVTVNKYLRKNHIFLLECGEIERLIKTISGHGIKWVDNVLEKYPNIEDEIYKEAKAFMEEIVKAISEDPSKV